MAIGWGAMAEGFGKGFALGTDAYDARTRRRLLEQKRLDELTDQTQTIVTAQLKNIDDTAQSVSQRDAEYEKLMEANKAQIIDTINMLPQTEKGQITKRGLEQIINTSWGKITMTASERAMAQAKAEAEGEITGARAMAEQQMRLQQPQATQPAPQATPAAAQTAPGIAGAEPQPQVAQAAQAPSEVDALTQEYFNRAMEKKYGASEQDKARTKMQFEVFGKLKEEADAATDTMTGAEAALKLLDQGIVTGAGAETFLKLGKWTGYHDKATIKRTEAFRAIMNEQVLAGIKQLGSSTAISDADREFMLGTVGADINLEKGALRDILTRSKTVGRKVVGKMNEEAKRLRMPEYVRELAPEENMQTPEGAQPNFQADEEGWVTGPGFRIRALP